MRSDIHTFHFRHNHKWHTHLLFQTQSQVTYTPSISDTMRSDIHTFHFRHNHKWQTHLPFQTQSQVTYTPSISDTISDSLCLLILHKCYRLHSSDDVMGHKNTCEHNYKQVTDDSRLTGISGIAVVVRSAVVALGAAYGETWRLWTVKSWRARHLTHRHVAVVAWGTVHRVIIQLSKSPHSNTYRPGTKNLQLHSSLKAENQMKGSVVECRTCKQKVSGSSSGWQEWQENFLFLGQLSAPTHFGICSTPMLQQ